MGKHAVTIVVLYAELALKLGNHHQNVAKKYVILGVNITLLGTQD